MDTIVNKEFDFEKFKGLTAGLDLQVKMRQAKLEDWLTDPELSERLSGTVKKNARIGFKYKGQLHDEALAQTMGWGFEAPLSSYVTFNEAVTEGDCHAITESGWHADRWLSINTFGDDAEVKYINVQDMMGNIERQGIGLVVKQTSVQWLGSGRLAIAMLAVWDEKQKQWSEVTNPF